MTEEGKSLYLGIVKYLRETRFSALSQDRTYSDIGNYKDVLGCNFTTYTYTFRVNQPGRIVARAKAQEPVALVLNGPSVPGSLSTQDRPFDRQDGLSTQVEFTATPELISRGKEWTVGISYFGDVTEQTQIHYDLSLDFPKRKELIWFWIVLGIAGFILVVFGVTKLFFVTRRFSRSETRNTEDSGT
ncbi:hypothetical protein ACE1AT_09210 [Pelatocladus sp. BLCC-F211]|uniref:hypothetical protein n=1 Tax=Pelatocladus sp. BLCC-F211 TaxID=3342752 RepID=UPI0035BAD192